LFRSVATSALAVNVFCIGCQLIIVCGVVWSSASAELFGALSPLLVLEVLPSIVFSAAVSSLLVVHSAILSIENASAHFPVGSYTDISISPLPATICRVQSSLKCVVHVLRKIGILSSFAQSTRLVFGILLNVIPFYYYNKDFLMSSISLSVFPVRSRVNHTGGFSITLAFKRLYSLIADSFAPRSPYCDIINESCLSTLASLSPHSSKSWLIRAITLTLFNNLEAALQAVLYQFFSVLSISYTSK